MIDSPEKFQKYIAEMIAELENDLASIAKQDPEVDEYLRQIKEETERAIGDLTRMSNRIARIEKLCKTDDISFDDDF